MEEPSYLVMTAADCAEYNEAHPHDIVSLNQMLEKRAHTHGDTVCVGFTARNGNDFGCETLTFSQLLHEVRNTAQYFQTKSSPALAAREAGNTKQKRIALLAPSCKEFLVNFMALVRLGYGVLLVAPQNTAEDVARLCQDSGIDQLVYHESLSKAAYSARVSSEARLTLLATVKQDELAGLDVQDSKAARTALRPEEESATECIIFHSSGSSGTPKPIPQKHQVWTKAAACKPHTPSFTTTPLFHGGISDLLRSMMAYSTLYVYPSTLPITSSNLLKAFEALPDPATSFLSVPYILELLGESEEGLDKLASLELVSTGGSPLPQATGDRFCERGVKLVSRYGSSECGFLMTSFREFASDKDWSYLRTTQASKKWLSFEDQGDDSYELVAPTAWPTRSKSNRDDGSYSTSDIFRKHPHIEDAWLLTGRSDDVLLMVNGEKTSPAPLEAILRSSSMVSDALVFGSNKATIGAAVVPSRDSTRLDDLLPLLKEVNRVAPAHSQIPSELLILLPTSASFPKASKGSLQRGRAYELFAQEIDKAYEQYGHSGQDTVNAQKQSLEGSDLIRYIQDVVEQTLAVASGSVPLDADLFSQGLTSLQSARIRNVLQKTLDVGPQGSLPANIVFECATIASLSEYIETRRSGSEAAGADNALALMAKLATDASLVGFDSDKEKLANGNSNGQARRTCILTGATGSLGAQLLPVLLARNNVDDVVCLVRADSDEAAGKRVVEALRKQKISLPDHAQARLRCYAAQLHRAGCGLSSELYTRLQSETVLVIHAAWAVHFGLSLSSFMPHLQGFHNLIQLAAYSQHQAKVLFCSSTASVLGKQREVTPEKLSRQPEDAAPMGYARSKHVAESICQAAWEEALPGRIGILRLGQLCGDTAHGIWNATEGWPLLFSTAGLVGCLPDLDETISWLPTDKAAAAIVDIAADSTSLASKESEVPVFHLVSGDSSRSYRDVLEDMRAAGLAFEVVPATEWLGKLAEEGGKGSDHPGLKMLDLWQKNYGKQASEKPWQPVFEMGRVDRHTTATHTPISSDIVRKMVVYWRSIGLIPA